MIDQYPSANGVLTSLIWRKTMSGGETSLSGYDNASQALSYTPGQEQVYLNGILLVRGDDYTATNGTSITGLTALSASDFVQVNCYNNFSVATLPTSGLTGTISNAQLQNSSITINGSAVSLGGSVSLPGDIESVTASSPLTGGGSSGAVTIGIQSASTTQSGAVQLTDSTSSTSTSTAATPNSVKSAYDLANGAIQKTLTTTTGDIIYASSANTPARLGIGSSGQVLSVSAGIPSWQTISTSPTFKGCAVRASNSISASNDTWTFPVMDLEDFDTDNFHSTTVNPTRITIPSGLGGKYLVVGQLFWDQSSSGARNTQIYKNGSGVGWVNYAPTPTWGGGGSWPSTPTVRILSLVAGDYLELAGMQQSGGTLNLSTWTFAVQYLGA
jgi:hypothetical protein